MTKAIAFSEFGPAEVLHSLDVELPAPGPGQVRIAVRAAGVNPLDHKIRAGVLNAVFPVTLPHVPGVEGAGTVEALGEGVTSLRVGDEVFGFTSTGSYAEQALAVADRLIVKPAAVPWEQAAALPVAAETAYRALELLGVKAGETLLVHGAAGGVGTLTVQFAVARGLTVIGTASEGNHAYLRELGAVPISYGEGLAERVRAAAPQGVDAVLDAAGAGVLELSVELTGSADRVITVADGAGAHQHGVRFTGGGDGQDFTRQALPAALELLAAGTLRLPIHRAYPLDEAAEAQRASAHGHLTGKLVITI